MNTAAHFKDAHNASHYDTRFFHGRIASPVRHQILLQLLGTLSDWSHSLGFQPILMHGALLGHYLGDGLLPWEDNINLVLPLDDLLKLSTAAPGFDTAPFFFDLNPHHASRATHNAHPLQNLEPNRVDARFVDRRTGLFVDVAAFVAKGDSLVTKCPRRWNRSDIYPLQPGKLTDVSVHIPGKSSAILARQYGDLDRIKKELPVIEHLRSLAHQPPPAMPAVHGRGIVTTASERYIPFLRELLDSLRRCNCNLPVEVWHRSNEIPPESIRELTVEQVSFHAFRSDDEPTHGFACKTAAIAASRFTEILFLDADNSVLADPTYLFDHPAYTATGAFLWPDQFYALRREPEFRRMLEIPQQFTPVESGQLLLDKQRHWRGIYISNEMNRAADLTYRFTHGDKDTFSMGFDMAGESYQLHPRRPQRLSDRSLIHDGPDGKPLFRHRAAGDSKFVPS